MPMNGTAVLLANYMYIIMEIGIGLCAVVGNVMVIWVVKLNPSLQTTTFYFIVSLALADIAVGLLVMPLAVVISLSITIHFYSCLLMTCLLLIFTHASIMSLLAIAVDRYLRVKLTVRSRTPEVPVYFLPFQVKVHFLPVMGLFILLSLTVFSEPSRNKNRSFRSSKVVPKADQSRMAIVINCMRITRVGTISIISHLSQRRRRQRNRRVDSSLKPVSRVLTLEETEQM
ncbi:hypothetical protein mRhiFer1_009071 [Rhinolophus ferrumequinum]|uniref:G-protein coupled receptors family 1 profile domain-containing protein n=1 Tax=Rhinolophus ferrumequinum TaxID=59479 RepID=A0A7J7SXP3_RHIFE|nr:hypothetical protein mRhiFer1_009071 [Rhinolophus ferrumequinum]